MFLSCDAADCADKFPPALALPSERFLTWRCQTVVTPPSLIGLFNPTPVNQAAIFEPVKQRIQRGDVEAQHAAREAFDELSDVVAVARLILEQGEYQ